MSVLAAGATAAVEDSPSDRIDRFVAEEMGRQQVPGVAVGVVQHGSVVLARGYGVANLEHRVPVTPATIFQSGSLGKQFTATAVMLQVEDGKLSLSDPVTKFFPDAPETWRAINIRHLLTHTSGIPDYVGGQIDYRKDYSEGELVRLAYELPLEFPAGSRWNYSNTGYMLLGVVVHQVSGSFYGDVLTARVFAPLGMTTARVIDEMDIVPDRAGGYRLVGDNVKNQTWVSPSLNTTADGSLYLSLRDLIAWDVGVRAGALLEPASWELILQPVRLTSGRTYPYGFGWFLDQRNGQPLRQHGGAWQGFKTQYSFFVGEDLSIIVLANLAQADPERFADGIAAIINPDLGTPALRPIDDPEPQTTERLKRLLDSARSGELRPADFAYVRAGFFPDRATQLEQELRKLGPARTMVLVEHLERGDDRIFTYEVTFETEARYYTVALAPDDRIAQFDLRAK